MKKIIITIVIFVSMGLTTAASAFYFDSPLINLWNSRPDLQKAFPGDPTHNNKLESWAKKYGWKESPELFNYYPDKDIVEKLIDNKTNSRITALEKQIVELNNKINQIQPGQTTTIVQTLPAATQEGTWRECRIIDGNNGTINCQLTMQDLLSENFINGSLKVYFLTK